MRKQEKYHYKIYIDTAQRDARSVTLLSINAEGEEKVIAERRGEIDVVSSIQGVLKDAGIKIANVAIFEANPGPGSFTGLKTGIVIANVLNWTLLKKEINSLQKPFYGSEPNITI